MNKIDVTVIVPVYNAEKYIKECVYSLFSQTLESIEFIFINDCCQDNSILYIRQVLSEFPKRKSDVRVINNKINLGVSACRNIGLDNANGEYISWVDSDDWIDQSMFERMLLNAKSENADMVCCDFWTLEGNNLKYQKQNLFHKSIDNIKAILTCKTVWPLWNKMVKRSIYNDHGMRFTPNANLGEDRFTCTQIFAHSKKNMHFDEALYYYRVLDCSLSHNTQLSMLKDSMTNCDSIVNFLHNHNLSNELTKHITFLDRKSVV